MAGYGRSVKAAWIAAASVAAALALPAAVAGADGSGPTPLQPPTISGLAVLGGTLVAHPAAFPPADDWGDADAQALQYAFQWLRCDAAGNNCLSISGATTDTYSPVQADVGDTLRVMVTLIGDDDLPGGAGSADQRGGGSSATEDADAPDDDTLSAVSAPTSVVPAPPPAPPAPTPPGNTAAPVISLVIASGQGASISGQPSVGGSLQATPGSWSGTQPITLSYQWLSCDASGGACVPIPGATASAYRASVREVGRTLRVAVTATNAAGSVTVESAPTAAVLPVPELHVSELLRPSGGSVRFRQPHATHFAPVSSLTLIPDGSTIDLGGGQAALTVATDAQGHTATANLSGQEFVVHQGAGAVPLTNLRLAGPPPVCSKADIAKHHARSLFAHDSGGHFSSQGRYASAIVRGTTWITTDTCEGTLVQVLQGSVTVHDRGRHRNVLVSAGHHYLAHAPEPAPDPPGAG